MNQELNKDILDTGVRRSNRLTTLSKIRARDNVRHLTALLVKCCQIKSAAGSTSEQLGEIYRRKMRGLFTVLKYTYDHIDHMMPYIIEYRNVCRSILGCIESLFVARYYHATYFRDFTRFNRMNHQLVTKVRGYAIRKWMAQHWVPAFTLNRVLREHQVPSAIYIHILKFYGDYTDILMVKVAND